MNVISCLLWMVASLALCAQAAVPSILFDAPRSLQAVGSISSVAVGDFNDDGIPDVVVAPSSDDITVYLGLGGGVFAQPVHYAVGAETAWVAVADFNGDGKLDLAVANFGNGNTGPNVAILLGNGDGTFHAGVLYATGYFPEFIAVADFNGDGKLDLAVTSTDGSTTISVLLGRGDGTFRDQVQYTVGTNPSTIAVADFNGDGNLDMAVANQNSNNLSILFGNGDGTFKPQVIIAVGQNPRSVVAGDFNEDGQPDLAVADNGSGVRILLGNPDGSFQQPIDVAIQEPEAIAVEDLNHDGHLDLAVSSKTDITGIFLGEGNGHFQLEETVSPGGLVVVAADLKGDGAWDLLVAPGAELDVLLSNFRGEFETAPNVAAGRGPYSVAVGDFNHDGNPDLVVANWGLFSITFNNVSILLGNGDGTFQPQVQCDVGSNPSNVAVGDFNRDGNLDIVATNSRANPGTISILFGNGDGTFQPQVQVSVGSASVSEVVVADFNHDGIPDLALGGNGDYGLLILIGNGDGTFKSALTYLPSAFAYIIVPVDLNGDGRIDLAIGSGPNIQVLFGNGDGTFQVPITIAQTGSDYPFTSLATGDFNGDGIPDLAMGGFSGGNPYTNGPYVGVLLGNGNGTFTPKGSYYFVNDATEMVAADFNGDGKTDLGMISRGSAVFLAGNGDGTFVSPPVHFALAGEGMASALGDFNRDGKPDLAVADYEPSNVTILTNISKR